MNIYFFIILYNFSDYMEGPGIAVMNEPCYINLYLGFQAMSDTNMIVKLRKVIAGLKFRIQLVD